MKAGEVKAMETETVIVPLANKTDTEIDFIVGNSEIAFSANEKITSNLKITERFSRLKKSLRKRSVSIL